MAVLVSDDGGDTWPVEKARILVEGARLVHDKQWLAVSPAGDNVLLCWDYSNALEQSTGVPPPPADDPLAATHPTTVVCSKSTDRGDTWSEMAVASERGAYPWLDFDAQGRAWMVLTDGFEEGEMLVLHSDDGVSWSEPVVIGNFTNGPERNDHGWPTLRGSEFRIVPVGSIGVDRSAGPHGGRVYVTWFDHGAAQRAADPSADASSTNESGDILLSWSDDGTTWSAPRVVNDDAPRVGVPVADQFMPVVSVGPDGTVDVSWQDRRDDPDNRLFHTYYAYSLDGGVTFSANLRVTSAASDEAHSHHQNGMVFLGDYRDSDSVIAGQTSMVWVDTRDGKADVRVATLTRPQANLG